MTALSYLRPTIDENSGAIAKGFAYVVDAATSLVAGITTVIAALAAFGLQLNAETAMSALRGAGSFLKGGAGGKVTKAVSGMGGKLRAAGGRMGAAGVQRGGKLGKMQLFGAKQVGGFGKKLQAASGTIGKFVRKVD